MLLNNHADMTKKIYEHLLEKSFISKQHLPYSCKKLIAFSLAEVLISLLIIGIVASLVIPTVIQDIQNAQYKTAYKNALANFSLVFMKMKMDHHGTLEGAFSPNHTIFESTFRQYFNLTAYSSTSTHTTNVAWHDYLNYKRLNGQNEVWNGIACDGCPSAQLADGSFFMIYYNHLTSDFTTCKVSGTHQRDGLCFDIVYDVNGKKSPNTFGKDIFILSVYRDKVVPADWSDDWGSINESSCTSSGTGYGCAIKYAKE